MDTSPHLTLSSWPSLVTLCLLISMTSAGAQSLGDIAAREADRRKGISDPARVITNGDLKPEPAAPTDGASPAPRANSSVDQPSSTAPESAQPRQLFTPAKFRGGASPSIPALAVGGGEVVLELDLNEQGRVRGVTTIRDTPPFTSALSTAVRTWIFQPALDVVAPRPGDPVDERTRRAIDSKVLVIGVFRPPALFSTTLGEIPKSVEPASSAVPSPTTPLTMPAYPPNALFDGIVLAELRVSDDGKIERASIVHSTAPFDQPTLEAVRALSFRPARIHGKAAPAHVYVVAGFRQPVLSP